MGDRSRKPGASAAASPAGCAPNERIMMDSAEWWSENGRTLPSSEGTFGFSSVCTCRQQILRNERRIRPPTEPAERQSSSKKDFFFVWFSHLFFTAEFPQEEKNVAVHWVPIISHFGSLMIPRHIFILVTTRAVTKLVLTVKAEPNVVLDYGCGPMTQEALT